jgi:hypothetical protein
MKTLSDRFAYHPDVAGWDLVQKHTDDLEWWADEIWELKSQWSPHGTRSFMTFLVDPGYEGVRRKGRAVWAVGFSACFPRDRIEVESGGVLVLSASKHEIEHFFRARQ